MDMYYKDASGCERFPIVSTQKDLLQLGLLGNNMSLSGGMRIIGKLDLERTKKAIQKLYDANDALRIKIFAEEGEFFQRVLNEYEYRLEVIQTKGDTQEEKYKYAENDLIENIKADIDVFKDDLFRVRLYEIDENNHFLGFIADHSIFDGASMPNVINQFFSYYNDPNASLHQDVKFVEYSQKLAKYLDGEGGKKEKEYWNDLLKGAVNAELPAPVSGEETGKGEMIITTFDKAELEEAARKNKTSVANMILLGVQLGAAKALKVNNGLINFAYANRTGAEERNMVGCLARLMVNICALRENETFEEAIRDNLKQTSKSIRFANSCSVAAKLYMTFHNFDMSIGTLEGLQTVPFIPEYDHKYDRLCINYWEREGKVVIVSEFDDEVVSRTFIQKIIDYAKEAVEIMVEAPESDVYEFAFGEENIQEDLSYEKAVSVVKKAFREVLDDEAKEDESFFEKGGNSLKAALLTEKINKSLETDILISDIYENETIKELADYIMKEVG